MTDLSRRDFIKKLTLLMGNGLIPIHAFSTSTIEAAYSYNQKKTTEKSSFSPQALSVQQLNIVSIIADIIIPKTDTPGAIQAGVPWFVDDILTHCVSKKVQTDFLLGLTHFNDTVNGFVQLAAKVQYQQILTLDNQLYQHAFYQQLKQWVVLGYYSSKIGASQELIYDAIPGPYHEVPLAKHQKAWS